MATFTTTNRTSYGKLTVLVTEGAGDISNNTSPITITIRYTSAEQYYMGITDFDVTDSKGTVLVNSYKRSYGVVSGISKGTVTIKTWSNLTAYHNDDGSGSLAIKLSYRIGNTTVYTDNFTMELATISRGSTLTLNSSSVAIDNTTGSLGYTITSDGDYYHKVTAKISTSATVVSGLEVNNTTYSGTIPYTTILSCIPASYSGTLTVTVSTYEDSAMTVSRGSRTATCTVIVSVKPTISSLTISSSLASHRLVAGYSYGIINYTTAKTSGALSVMTYITATNMTTVTSSDLTSSVNTPTFPASTSSSTITVTAYAIDSRGIRSDDVQTTATVYGYAAPKITCDFYRTSNSSGTPVPDETGTNVYVTYSATYTITWTGYTTNIYATFNGTSISNGSYSALAETSTATILVHAEDDVTSVEQEFTVPVALFAVDIYDNGGGDTGVAFGGISRSGYNDNFLIGTGDLYYDASNGNSIALSGTTGNVTLIGIAESTSNLIVTVWLPKLVSGTPSVSATASWARGNGTTQTPSAVGLDSYGANWVKLSVGGTFTQYQVYAVQFSALTITFS